MTRGGGGGGGGGRGKFGPEGHGWQDLWRRPLNIATY